MNCAINIDVHCGKLSYYCTLTKFSEVIIDIMFPYIFNVRTYVCIH